VLGLASAGLFIAFAQGARTRVPEAMLAAEKA
jgi:hypothetical protein